MSGAPKLGSTVFEEKKPEPEKTLAGENAEAIYGFEITEMELTDPGLSHVPQPPKCVAERLKRQDLTYRWMSRPQVAKAGMRNYVTVSPTAKEREAINSGRDQPPGVHVDVENKICWREDAWLAAIPRKLYELRERQRRLRTQAQTEAAFSHEHLAEQIGRMGGKAQQSVEQWEQLGE